MIALLTPTGARPQQMQLCARYMARQTYTGPVVWVLVDDAWPCSTDVVPADFRAGWDILKVYPVPIWQPGQNTQGRNIAAGIAALLKNYKLDEIEAIFIIEDDDWYGPQYLEMMLMLRHDAHIWGETHTVYYNVVSRTWWENQNALWSSLFQMAFTMQALPFFATLYGQKFIDFVFCQTYKGGPVRLFRAGNLGVGIKGQPGRAGIGAGHRDLPNHDPQAIKLAELLGTEDAAAYLSHYRHMAVT
jgi:hypothetical protein